MVMLMGVLSSLSPYPLPSINADSNRSTSVSPTGSSAPLPPASPSPPPEEDDVAKRAEKIKDKGNVAFKATKYAEAIELYTKATGPQTSFFLFSILVASIHSRHFHPNQNFLNFLSAFIACFPNMLHL